MRKKDLVVSDGDSRSVIIFRDGKNNPKVEVLFRQNMLWLKQSQIAELFDVQTPAISKHLKNIFEDSELLENSVISILETTEYKHVHILRSLYASCITWYCLLQLSFQK